MVFGLFYLIMAVILSFFMYRLIRVIYKRINIGSCLLPIQTSVISTIFFYLIIPLAFLTLQFFLTYDSQDISRFNIVFPTFVLIASLLSVFRKLILSAEGFYEEGIVSLQGIFSWSMIQSAELTENECLIKIDERRLLFDSYHEVSFKVNQMRLQITELLLSNQIKIENQAVPRSGNSI